MSIIYMVRKLIRHDILIIDKEMYLENYSEVGNILHIYIIYVLKY